MRDLVGQHLGNYRLVRLLGRGGFGAVYLGEQVHLQSDAALKVLNGPLTKEQQAAFVQEAQTLVRLRHPHIVRLLDFALEAGEPFLVMEYAPGGSLRTRYPAGTRLAFSPVLAYVQQMASALQYAHTQHVIHRDVKPENLLLGPQGEVLLSDFGLALFPHQPRLFSLDEPANQVAGTSLYLAPEQLQGDAQPQSDQYALAVVVYEWLCGMPPFSGTPSEIARQHLTMPPPPLRAMLPDLSPAVEAVILRALAKEPEQRFGTIQEFASALQQASLPAASLPGQSPGASLSSASLSSSGRQAARPFWKVPSMLTPVVGREQEVNSLRALLSQPEVRLVTLLGPGGIGKTRLSFQLAQALREQFIDGVCFIPLAAINDAALLIPAVAEALEIQERGEYSLEQRVMFAVANKQMLFVLDNFEQVLSAAALVERLLTVCPHIKILVTSRAVLYVPGEHEFLVAPLSLPDLRQLPPRADLAEYAAIALFVQRARAALASFELTESNARAVAEICVRLDGLPLAIELAAARIRLLSPAALLARLSQRLSVLTSGGRTLPERQQTLRNTLKWSYDLLDEREQKLFCLLSVFVGGWTMDAVETLWQANSEARALPALDGLTSLLDKSLLFKVEQEGEELRLLMLETVREYGWECAHASGEAEVICRSHAAYFLTLARLAEPHLKGSGQIAWLHRLEQEHENMRAALHWLIDHQETEAALSLAGALWRFWYLRGYWSEGHRWLTLVLNLPQAESFPAGRAKALGGVGRLALHLENTVEARRQLEACVALYRELGDKQGLAESLTMWEVNYRHAPLAFRLLLDESISLAREIGDRWVLSTALQELGWFTVSHESVEAARPFMAESATLFREIGDIHGLTAGLSGLITVETMQGHITQAAGLVQEYLGQARELGNTPVIIDALYMLSYVAVLQGQYAQAIAAAQEGLVLARELGDKAASGRMAGSLGEIAVEQGKLQEAAAYLEEALAIFREVGNKDNCSAVLSSLGDIRRLQGEIQQTRVLYNEGFALASEVGNKVNMGWCLIGLALVESSYGQPERAALLFGAAEASFNARAEMNPKQRVDYEHAFARVQMQLGEEWFTAAWAQGQALPPEEAFARAEQPALSASALPFNGAPAKADVFVYPDDLTAREVEVLRLLAQGQSDAQIAEQLVISPRTVNRHTTSIYSKIGVSSRSAATRYAIEHHLA